MFFEISDPNAPATVARNVLSSHRPPLADAVFWTLIALAHRPTVLALGYRRSGEADARRQLADGVSRRGGTVVGCRAHHVPLGVEEATLVLASRWVPVWTAFVWATYGPNRPSWKWPVMLRSFRMNRLADARDPIVGRSSASLPVPRPRVLLLTFTVGHRSPPEALLYPALQGLRSTRAVFAMLAFHVTDVLQFVLAGVLFLVLLRLILRNSTLASLAWVVLVAPLSTGEALDLGAQGWGWNLALAAGLGLFGLVILLRFGVLAGLVMLLFGRLTVQSPMTLDVGAWYFSVSLALLCLLGALAVYGFIVALGGRPSFGDAAIHQDA